MKTLGRSMETHNIVEPDQNTYTPTSDHVKPIDVPYDKQSTPAKKRTKTMIVIDIFKNHWSRWLALCIVIAIIIWVIVDYKSDRLIANFLSTLLKWMGENPMEGIFAFAGVYVVATICFFPAAVLTIGAGATFAAVYGFTTGIPIAVAAVFIGAYTGLILAFLLGRYILFNCTRSLAKRWPIVIIAGQLMWYRDLS
eukprot:GHVL01009471.1.p1 GENE.GHVL01009471.1~~GHVL01009471.1.p1  ORF type:complete len:196 (+),score=5.59 GHVL01009471.1:43-630(+)